MKRRRMITVALIVLSVTLLALPLTAHIWPLHSATVHTPTVTVTTSALSESVLIAPSSKKDDPLGYYVELVVGSDQCVLVNGYFSDYHATGYGFVSPNLKRLLVECAYPSGPQINFQIVPGAPNSVEVSLVPSQQTMNLVAAILRHPLKSNYYWVELDGVPLDTCTVATKLYPEAVCNWDYN